MQSRIKLSQVRLYVFVIAIITLTFLTVNVVSLLQVDSVLIVGAVFILVVFSFWLLTSNRHRRQTILVGCIAGVEYLRSVALFIQQRIFNVYDTTFNWYSLRIGAVIIFGLTLLLFLNRPRRYSRAIHFSRFELLGVGLLLSGLLSSVVGLLNQNDPLLVLNDYYRFFIMGLVYVGAKFVDTDEVPKLTMVIVGGWFILLLIVPPVAQLSALSYIPVHSPSLLLPIGLILASVVIRRAKVWPSIAIIFGILGIVLTNSRGSWVAVVVMLLISILVGLRHALVRVIGWAGFVALAILIMFGLGLSDNLLDNSVVQSVQGRYVNGLAGDASFGETSYRTREINYAYWQMEQDGYGFATNIFGLGNGSIYYGLVRDGTRSIHFTPMAIFFRLGALGLVAYLSMVTYAVFWLYRMFSQINRKHEFDRTLLLGTMLYTIGLFVFSLRGYSFIGDVIWPILMGLSYSRVAALRTLSKTASPLNAPNVAR